MHELPIVKSVFKTVIQRAEKENATAVNRVVLEVGVLRDFVPVLVQKYWDYVSKGSVAEDAVVEIREVNAGAMCNRCSCSYEITRDNISEAKCPSCGCPYGKLVRGNELRIMGIEIVRNNVN